MGSSPFASSAEIQYVRSRVDRAEREDREREGRTEDGDRKLVATVVEQSYEPSAALVRFVRARDRHCQFPGCGMPASRCELDHVKAYDHDDPVRGGQTTAINLCCLCKHHHRVKHSDGWSLERTPDGQLHWTSPAGEDIVVDPPDLDVWMPEPPHASSSSIRQPSR